jgi:hypothetical protein
MNIRICAALAMGSDGLGWSPQHLFSRAFLQNRVSNSRQLLNLMLIMTVFLMDFGSKRVRLWCHRSVSCGANVQGRPRPAILVVRPGPSDHTTRFPTCLHDQTCCLRLTTLNWTIPHAPASPGVLWRAFDVTKRSCPSMPRSTTSQR